MSKNRSVILVDNNGWVTGMRYAPPLADLNKLTKGGLYQTIVVPHDMAIAIMGNPKIIFWSGSEFKKITDPKKIWYRMTSTGGGEMAGPEYAEILSRVNDGKIPFNSDDIDHPIVEVKTVNKIHQEVDLGLPIEIQPDLIFRFATEADLDVWEKQMIISGVYNQASAWRTVAGWLASPRGWPMVTEYKNEVLQVEEFYFPPNDSRSIIGGFASHVDNTRPRWFWTVISKPWFQILDQLRIEYIHSDVKAEYTTYIQYLQDTYGGQVYSQHNPSFVQIKTSVKSLLDNTPDFPSRLSAGAGWKYTKTIGGKTYLVREATGAEMSALIPIELDKMWATNTPARQAEIKNILDKRYNLDKSTFILGFTDGKLITVRFFCRKDISDVSTLVTGSLNKAFLTDKETVEVTFDGIAEWMTIVGAERFTQYIDKPSYDAAKSIGIYRQNVSHQYSTPVVKQDVRGDYIVYTTDVKAYLANKGTP